MAQRSCGGYGHDADNLTVLLLTDTALYPMDLVVR